MKKLIIGTIILYSNIFLVTFLESTNVFIADDGGVFNRGLMTCIFSSIFFLILKPSIKQHFGIGFIVGILSNLLLFFIYMNVARPESSTVKKDHCIVTTIVFLIGLIYFFIQDKKIVRDWIQSITRQPGKIS